MHKKRLLMKKKVVTVKNTSFENSQYMSDFLGFSFMVILNLQGINFHPVVVLGPEHDFLFKSTSTAVSQEQKGVTLPEKVLFGLNFATPSSYQLVVTTCYVVHKNQSNRGKENELSIELAQLVISQHFSNLKVNFSKIENKKIPVTSNFSQLFRLYKL